MRETTIKRRLKSKRKSAKVARKKIKKIFAKRKKKVIKRKAKTWNKRVWKFLNDSEEFDVISGKEDESWVPSRDPFNNPTPKDGEVHLHSGNGTTTDLHDNEEDEKQNDSPKEVGILADGIDIDYYPTHHHESGSQKHCVMNSYAIEEYNAEVSRKKSGQQRPRDRPNVGLLVALFLYKGQVLKKYGTATVIGATKRTLITVAHNLIGHEFDKSAIANKVTFYRGMNQAFLPRFENGQICVDLSMAAKRYRDGPDCISAERWIICPGYTPNSQKIEYDVALIRLAKPCVRAEIARLLNTSVRMPKACRLDGYPSMSLKETFGEMYKTMREVEDPQIRKRFIGYRSQKMYGAYGDVINCEVEGDFDWIGHTCYASEGQSGAALMVTDRKGVYSEGAQTIFALHHGGTNWDEGLRIKLTAVLLHKGMLDWILAETKSWNIGENIQVASIRSGYHDCFIGKNNPELDGYFKELEKIDVHGDF